MLHISIINIDKIFNYVYNMNKSVNYTGLILTVSWENLYGEIFWNSQSRRLLLKLLHFAEQ